MNIEDSCSSPDSEKLNPIREITQPFIDLIHAPRALWGVNATNFLEGLVYFGILTLLAIFLNEYVGLTDNQADPVVGLLTGGITFAMLFLGGLADRWGVRTALLVSLFLMLIGRIIFTGAACILHGGGLWSPLFWLVCLGILFVVLGYGMYQPACYAGVKKFCDEKTAPMGYAMLYAVMNLGGFMPALISPPVRKHFGITGVFWVYIALTVLSFLLVYFILSKETEQQAIKAQQQEEAPTAEERAQIAARPDLSWREWLWKAIREHPLADGRFTFFIFILIPVQTLFAHNWLTMPQYVDRAYTGVVQQNMEFFVNINPLLIFILTPMVASLTRKADVYRMMIAGTFVMSLPTFILALGPHVPGLFLYIFLVSVGEAMWQPRFLQFVAEIAPEGKTGAYMGIAQFPWFLTKLITSFYAGSFLTAYCPKEGPQNTGLMWLIYGFIAMLSPICLLIFGKWARRAMHRESRQS